MEDEMTPDPLNSQVTPVLVDRVPLFEQEGVRGVAVRSLLRIDNTSTAAERIVRNELEAHPEWNEFDRALYQELVFGTLRWRAKLDWVLTGFYHGEFSKCLPAVQQALRVALYQILMISKIPPQQAIDSTARIIERTRNAAYATTLVGILRAIARNVGGIRYPPRDQLAFHFSVVYSHPLWLVERWLDRYGEELTEQMLAANLERPPIYLAANRLRIDDRAFLEWISSHAIPFETVPNASGMVRINPFADYTHFECWQHGHCYLSDPIYAHAADQWAQRAEGPVLYASTQPSRALLPILECAERARLPVTVWTEPVPVLPTWIKHECTRLEWQLPAIVSSDDQQTYKSIIIEAESSGIGLWRRKPERKWRTDSLDIHRSVRRLIHHLNQLVPRLEPGGTLLLIVASTEPDETDAVTTWLCRSDTSIKLVPFGEHTHDASVYGRPDGTRQTLPHTHRGDSVYVALFERMP